MNLITLLSKACGAIYTLFKAYNEVKDSGLYPKFRDWLKQKLKRGS